VGHQRPCADSLAPGRRDRRSFIWCLRDTGLFAALPGNGGSLHRDLVHAGNRDTRRRRCVARAAPASLVVSAVAVGVLRTSACVERSSRPGSNPLFEYCAAHDRACAYAPRNHQYVAVRRAEFVLARRLKVGAGFLRPILCREDFVPLQIVGKGMLETSRLSGACLITHAGHAYSVCSESRR